MKFNKNKTISARKNRKSHFNANQQQKRIRMSSTLSKDLISKWGFKSFPIKIKDKVTVLQGKYKGKTGSVVGVKRRKYKVYVDCCEFVRPNGKKSYLGVDASNLRIEEFDMEFERSKKLEAKKEARLVKAN